MKGRRQPANDRSGKGANHSLGGCAECPADRALHHDNYGEHGPIALLQAERFVGGISRANCNGDTNGLAQLRGAARQEFAGPGGD